MECGKGFGRKHAKRPASYYARMDLRTTGALREWARRSFHGLDGGCSPFRWRMLQYILLGTPVDWDAYYAGERTLLAPRGMVVAMANGSCRSSRRLLEDFSGNVIPLKIHGYSKDSGIATCVTPMLSPEEWEELDGQLARAYLAPEEERDTFFVSGRRVTKKAAKKGARSYLDYVISSDEECHPARTLIEFLNSQSSQPLERLLRRNYERIRAEVQRLLAGGQIERQRGMLGARVHSTLVAQMDDGYLEYHYEGKERTARIYATGVTVASLPREVRTAAMAGTTHADLRSAQLGIVAMMYGAMQTRRFLDNGGNIWRALYEHMGVGPTEKPGLKAGLYALCYGAGEKRIGAEMRANGLTDANVAMFLRHPYIAEILAGRKRHAKQIEEAGGIFDAFGWFWELSAPDSLPHHLQAIVAQSYEVAIMLPIVEVLRRKSVSVPVWLHDGLYMLFPKGDRRESALAEMKTVVEHAAAGFGIPTCMEVEEL